jgi:hypothetical protein
MVFLVLMDGLARRQPSRARFADESCESAFKIVLSARLAESVSCRGVAEM